MTHGPVLIRRVGILIRVRILFTACMHNPNPKKKFPRIRGIYRYSPTKKLNRLRSKTESKASPVFFDKFIILPYSAQKIRILYNSNAFYFLQYPCILHKSNVLILAVATCANFSKEGRIVSDRRKLYLGIYIVCTC